MVSFVADTLSSNNPIGVVEAGTGTGKTIALCSGAVPVARQRQKTLVIVTATVGLQSQLLNQELIELARLDDEPISFQAAKGRRRYVCLAKLERFETNLRFSEGSTDTNDPVSDFDAPNELFRQFRSKSWDGDLDGAPVSVSAELNTAITTELFGCQGTACKWYAECPYYAMREDVRQADIVVANYDLLLQDLLIDSQILPDPTSSIYLLDEAHKLHDKTLSAFSKRLDLPKLALWVQELQEKLVALVPKLRDQSVVTKKFGTMRQHADVLLAHVDKINKLIDQFFQSVSDNRLLFAHGTVPTELVYLVRGLLRPLNQLLDIVTEFHIQLQEVSEGRSDWIPNELIPEQAESFGRFAADGESFHDLLVDWSDQSSIREAARWVSEDSRGDRRYTLNTVNIDVNDQLKAMLWDHCEGAVCTSATLTTTDGFDHFIAQVGLPSNVNQLALESPFDFRRQVRLSIPRMKSQPQHEKHNAEVAKLLPALLKKDKSGLVIFSSYVSMNAVLDFLPKRFLQSCLIQGQQPWEVTIDEHRRRIETDRLSYLFGLAAFREGIDLPNDLCRHVIITRLPFEVPTDPVLKSRKERLELQGISSYQVFMKLELPEMTLRLKQACGRLMRSEDDYGKITILDDRIVKRKYGESVLESLPPYRRDF